DAKEVAVALRRVGERIVEQQRGPRYVRSKDVHDRQRMRGGRHVRQVELRDLADRGENVIQLLGQAADLILAQIELRERRYVQDVLSRDCHRLESSQKTKGPLSG